MDVTELMNTLQKAVDSATKKKAELDALREAHSKQRTDMETAFEKASAAYSKQSDIVSSLRQQLTDALGVLLPPADSRVRVS